MQQQHEMIVQLPYATAIPINILDIYAIRDEMYFHVLCEDNTVQILHWKAWHLICIIVILENVIIVFELHEYTYK